LLHGPIHSSGAGVSLPFGCSPLRLLASSRLQRSIVSRAHPVIRP
jgi:hypothetical protein